MGVTEVLAKMGISAAALVPSFIGASLRTMRDEGKNFWEHVIGVISGVATAAFLTPFFVQVAGMPEQSEAGVGVRTRLHGPKRGRGIHGIPQKEKMSWLSKVLSVGDEVSSKRTVGILGAAALIVTMIVNSFTNQEIAPSDALVNAVLILTLGSLGLTSVDKFANGVKNTNGK